MTDETQRIFNLMQNTMQAISDSGVWRYFLRTAAWHFKYSFNDQVLIFAQKSEATACAGMDDWVNKTKRWVNKNASPIALVRENGNQYYLDYVFDISDSITQMPGSFIKTKNAILKLIENDIPLQISCPIMKQNKESYVDVIEWGKQHKVRVDTDYVIMARYDHSLDNLDNRLSLDEVGKVITNFLEAETNYNKRLVEADFEEIDQKYTGDDILCGVCISSLCMVANGNIYPCAGWQNYVCGNVNEQSLAEIWNKSEKVLYLRNLRKKDMPECIDCPDRHFCVVCMVRNANEDPEGNPLKINKHFCKVAALNRQIALDWKAKLQETQ